MDGTKGWIRGINMNGNLKFESEEGKISEIEIEGSSYDIENSRIV